MGRLSACEGGGRIGAFKRSHEIVNQEILIVSHDRSIAIVSQTCPTRLSVCRPRPFCAGPEEGICKRELTTLAMEFHCSLFSSKSPWRCTVWAGRGRWGIVGSYHSVVAHHAARTFPLVIVVCVPHKRRLVQRMLTARGDRRADA